MVSKTLMLGLLALCFTVPAFAGTSMRPSSLNLCHSERRIVRQIWQQDLYSVPPAVASVMLDAIDGKASVVRKALAAMSRKDVNRWRQLAMHEAAFEGRADTVEALLNDGAKANGSALKPPLKAAFYHRLVDQDTKDPRIGPKAVKAFQEAGIINNDARKTPQAIYGAIECDDLAIARILLRHGANPMQLWRQHSADPFIEAVVGGHADITKAFLDHGAEPCVEDRRLAKSARREHHPHARTVSYLGLKAGLPSALIRRLICHANPSSN